MSKVVNKDLPDRQNASKVYNKLTEKFKNACHSFDSLREELEKAKPEISDDPMLNGISNLKQSTNLILCEQAQEQ